MRGATVSVPRDFMTGLGVTVSGSVQPELCRVNLCAYICCIRADAGTPLVYAGQADRAAEVYWAYE